MLKPSDAGPRKIFSRRIRRSDRQIPQPHKILRVAESAALVLVTMAACLLLCELAVRVAVHAPLLALQDFRHQRAEKTLNQTLEYDSVLGWHLKPFFKSDGYNTLELGVRANGNAHTQVRPGGVLAVGSSFTLGDVNDDQTWPAQLAQITGWNVTNAGVGGYEADQIIMNAERLLPIVRPQVLIIDMIPDNIVGAGFSSAGWPKPYFTVENGELIQHNVPVPKASDTGHDRFRIKWFFGHFAVADQLMSSFLPNFWFSSNGSVVTTINNDAVDVTCHLLARLKQHSEADHVVPVLYLQFASSHIFGAAGEARQSVAVAKCAQDLRIAIVDEYADLRRIHDDDPNALRKFYLITANGSMGHKSPFGSMQAARLIASAIDHLGLSAELHRPQDDAASEAVPPPRP
jgi:hypothetical protein